MKVLTNTFGLASCGRGVFLRGRLGLGQQQGQRILSPVLLYKTKTSVKNKQKADDDSFRTLAQNQF